MQRWVAAEPAESPGERCAGAIVVGRYPAGWPRLPAARGLASPTLPRAFGRRSGGRVRVGRRRDGRPRGVSLGCRAGLCGGAAGADQGQIADGESRGSRSGYSGRR